MLEHLRIVDFSKVLAGPLCTQYLADMGAEVIKVETIDRGDDTRGWPPFHQDTGTVFLSANRNKRSIALDMKTCAGQKIARQLIQQADVVVESFAPGVTTRLGIDYESAKKLKSNIIYCSITGFGSVGPLKNAKGYDVILQAFSGMMATTGEQAGTPARSPFSPVDQATGMHAAIGILGAVIRHGCTGKGTYVEASLFDTAVGFLGYMSQSYWERKTEPQRWGSAHESLCPYQAFDTQDKPILLGIANDTLWQAFCRDTGAIALAQNSSFNSNAGRVEHRAEVVAAVQAILRQRTRDDWITRFTLSGIPCASIQGVGEMLNHPHTLESGMVQTWKGVTGPPLNVISQPLRFDGVRNAIRAAPPAHGEHTHDILSELGYSEAEIVELTERGSINASAGLAGSKASASTISQTIKDH